MFQKLFSGVTERKRNDFRSYCLLLIPYPQLFQRMLSRNKKIKLLRYKEFCGAIRIYGTNFTIYIIFYVIKEESGEKENLLLLLRILIRRIHRTIWSNKREKMQRVIHKKHKLKTPGLHEILILRIPTLHRSSRYLY